MSVERINLPEFRSRIETFLAGSAPELPVDELRVTALALVEAVEAAHALAREAEPCESPDSGFKAYYVVDEHEFAGLLDALGQFEFGGGV